MFPDLDTKVYQTSHHDLLRLRRPVPYRESISCLPQRADYGGEPSWLRLQTLESVLRNEMET